MPKIGNRDIETIFLLKKSVEFDLLSGWIETFMIRLCSATHTPPFSSFLFRHQRHCRLVLELLSRAAVSGRDCKEYEIIGEEFACVASGFATVLGGDGGCGISVRCCSVGAG
jgi:hypothetical protein